MSFSSKHKIKVSFSFLLIFSFYSFYIFSQTTNTGTKLSTRFEVVTGGTPITGLQTTSYGFAFINDGRMLTAISKDGVKLFERGLRDRSSSLLTVTSKDFFYVVSSNYKKLSLYNPDGVMLWQKEVDEPLTSKPITGYDGRVFVHSNSKAYCFGINGEEKWSLEIEKGITHNLKILNDGSLLFIGKTENGMSKATRVSPYGQLLEDITFAGSITYSTSITDGVLLLFSDGTVGLCSVKNKKAESTWSIKNVVTLDKVGTTMLKELENNKALVLTNSGSFSVIDLKKQQIDFTKTENNIKPISIYNISVYSDTKKLVILSKNFTSTFVVGYSFQGTKLFDFTVNSNNKTEGIYLSNGIVALCDKDWTAKGYLPYQNTVKVVQNLLKTQTKKYPQFYTEIDFIPESQYLMILQNGNYGFREEEINSYIKNSLYEITLKNSSGGVVGVVNSELDNYQYLIELITLASYSGIDFSDQIAQIITTSKDSAILKSAFSYAALSGYDPYSRMINAIENKFMQNIANRKDEGFYVVLCDGVYNICKTMGTPVLYNQGKRILSKMLTMNFSQGTRNHITSTLNMILDLQMWKTALKYKMVFCLTIEKPYTKNLLFWSLRWNVLFLFPCFF